MMKPEHVSRLLKHHSDLTQRINVNGRLYTYLVDKDVLDHFMIRFIQNQGSSTNQVDQLLEELSILGEEAFQLFCDALIEDGQGHIVEQYLKAGRIGPLSARWLDKLAERVGSSWRHLGSKLGFTDIELDHMETKHPHNPHVKIVRMLCMWNEAEFDKSGHECMQQLRDIFAEIGRIDLAKRLPDVLPGDIRSGEDKLTTGVLPLLDS
ncbi:uncharacterized protein LOC106171584 [Lingula anatina]|uniref:Uncharacterized protein LOC106171584 n=1 Tax=Lingula anatina TaxID=7574 RepID=A0A1S3JB88_LINAN|nr:uncharacterized protein LOC106171584 [Lingula anatina]|eukprot:XP_013407456.1 uncharacterized protein LOC106171584 [Lingula anatina]